ncbi:MAG TPA: hypothetical protein VFR44_02220 [Actinomycetota bacterium]|nr:hypothetical protein [Actinomycetota bacterium]
MRTSIAVAVVAVVLAAAGAPAAADVPFGPNDLVPRLYGHPYTGTKLYFIPTRAVRRLNQARRAGMRVIVKLAGSQEHYRDPDGSFSLRKWKARVDEYRDAGLEEFVEDGTIVAHQLVSEAKADDQWGGTIIPNDVLDEMAAYSESIWPGMPTLVRADAVDLEEDAAGPDEPWPGGWTWTYLDAASSRYSARKGRPAGFARTEQAAADRQGLALAIGMNVLSGGDGSSGIPSPERGDAWAMSPRELRTYSAELLEHSAACSFEMWKYFPRATYFEKRRIVRAMKDVAAIAAASPTVSCAAPPR